MKSPKTPRPISVTIIGWLLVVAGALMLVSVPIYINSDGFNVAKWRDFLVKLPTLLAINLVNNLASLLVLPICGAAMLKGRNWARQFWVGWSFASSVFACIASRTILSHLPGLAVLLVIAVILYRPKATRYFSPKRSVARKS